MLGSLILYLRIMMFQLSGFYCTWRVGGLSNWLFSGLTSTITPFRVPFRVLISLLTAYLLSPPDPPSNLKHPRKPRRAAPGAPGGLAFPGGPPPPGLSSGLEEGFVMLGLTRTT